MEQIPFITNNNNSSHQTQSIIQKKKEIRSKTVGFTLQKKLALTVVSIYNLILKKSSFFFCTITSSNNTFTTKSSFLNKKTVIKRKNLILLNPKILFRAFEEAENCEIKFSLAINNLWLYCNIKFL